MSTRSTTHFHYGDDRKPAAIVYRHPDGYPEAMLPDLQKFFADVQAQTNDYRFGDPNYLAAKWCVWLADMFREHSKYDPDTGKITHYKGELLDFISVGIMMEDPGDIEYRYHVWCGSGRPVVLGQPMPEDGTPQVTYDEL